MAKSNHLPSAKALPPDKTARTGPNTPDDTGKATPVWSLAIFDDAGPWGKAKCGENDALWAEIYPKLRQYETRTWNEILANRTRDHAVPIHKLVKQARDRLETLKIDDVDELFRFRLSGTMRVWGIRVGRVFQLLWWDPEHIICPSNRN